MGYKGLMPSTGTAYQSSPKHIKDGLKCPVGSLVSYNLKD